MNVQTERGQQSAKDRKFGEVVKTDNGDFKPAGARSIWRDLHVDPVLRVQTGGQPYVCSDFLGRKSREVVLIHPDKELVDNCLIQFRTKRPDPMLKFRVEHNSCYDKIMPPLDIKD